MAHSWQVSPQEAIAIQQDLRARVETSDRIGEVHFLAGVDVGFEDAGEITRAAVAVLDRNSLAVVDARVARLPTTFPYVPGLLSFREIPAVLVAFSELEVRPDLILCDGQGIAHPRRCGIATHLGLLLDMPTIGVAKSRLVGRPAGRLPPTKGAWVPLQDGEETIGAVLRTRDGVNPLFVSTGHRVSLESAIKWVIAATTRYRLPETTRWAHRLASQR